MSFAKLIVKVDQAEAALEAQERQVVADLRQLKRSWRAAWTPGRIVVAGLLGGFLVGRAEPLDRAMRSGGMLRLVSMLSGLLASASAQSAASNADEAADSARETAAAAAPATAAATASAAGPGEP